MGIEELHPLDALGDLELDCGLVVCSSAEGAHVFQELCPLLDFGGKDVSLVELWG